MVFERRWAEVPLQSVLSNGDSSGFLAVADPAQFIVKQLVTLKSNSLSTPKEFEVKRVISTGIYLGLLKTPIDKYADLTGYTTAANTQIHAKEQERNSIRPEFVTRAVYQEEPAVALRTLAVDALGNKYSAENPIPVQLSDGSINIGTVNAELEVQLNHKDGDPDTGDIHDSIRIGDGTNEVTTTPSIGNAIVGIDTVQKNSIFTKPYTQLTVLTKNDDGDPLTVRTRYNGTNVQLATITYDSNGDFEDVQVSDL